MKKPTRHSSRIAYENRWFAVRCDDITWPDGTPGEYFTVATGGACIVIPVQDGSVCLIEQYRVPTDSISLEFPMGRIDPKENPEAAARRECREEVGLHANTLEYLGSFDALNGIFNSPFHVFVATDLEPRDRELEPAEKESKTFWMRFEEWEDAIASGRVRDGDSLGAWAMYSAKQRMNNIRPAGNI